MHRVQGVIAMAAQEGVLFAPDPSQSGRLVVEFQRDSESGGFAIAINHAISFANPRATSSLSSRSDPLQLHDNFVHLPEGALTAIIVGCESNDHDEIASIVKEHPPNVRIKRRCGSRIATNSPS
jgi:hypothetical protein